MKARKISVIFLTVILTSMYSINAQVAITDVDGYSPNNSAVLDVHSSSKGLLVPRMTATQISSISSPADGLLVYNTDTKQFYFYSSAKAGWNAIGSGGGGVWSAGSGNIYLSNLDTKVGIGTSNPLSKLEVIGDASIGIDDPLFEVKNNSGETVFAVHQEGVRVYVADGNAKGTKGGFAISGIEATKNGQEFLRVTPDSTRIYVKESTSKGTKGGFAISGFDDSKQGSESFLQITPDNYFIGHLAGYSITTGLYNSFMGYQSGFSTTEGNYNVFLGRGTGYANTTGSENIFIGDLTGNTNTTGYANVFVGDASGYTNTDGYWNIFLGRSSGYSNASGYANIIIGDFAGFDNTSGYKNVLIGDYAGGSNTDGYNNVSLGANAGWANTSGHDNVFIGTNSGYFNELGNWNVFVGREAGYSSTEGVSNVYLGQKAGYSADTANYNVIIGTLAGEDNYGGHQNVFLGQQAGQSNSEGSYNTFVGVAAGWNSTTGQQNVVLGNWAATSNDGGSWNVYLGGNTGSSNVSGNFNTFVGDRAGYLNTGSSNIFIGRMAGYNETGSNKLYIESAPDNTSDRYNSLIYGEFDEDFLDLNAEVYIKGSTSTFSSGFALTVNGDARANSWGAYSDIRLKKNVKTLTGALEKVKTLRGVSYQWKKEAYPDKNLDDKNQIGVIAQEVEEVFPELVDTDEDGYKTVQYAKLTPVLLEAIKEQQNQIEELAKTVERMNKINSDLRTEFNTLKSEVEKNLMKQEAKFGPSSESSPSN